MRKLSLAVLVLAGCTPSWQVRLQRDLDEAAAAEARGDFLRAIQIYESWRGKAEDPKFAAQVDQRSRAAADRALAQGEGFEKENAHLKAAQHFEKLQQLAGHLLGERVTTALARARGAAYEQAVREGKQLEQSGRWREAVAKYESVESIAEKLGKSGELADALLSARRSLFDAEVQEGKKAQERSDWSRAVGVYEGLRTIAQKIGRESELQDLLQATYTAWYTDAGEKAGTLARSREWDRALEAYERARRAARAIGREEELNRAVADVKVSRALDRGEKLESQNRWAEALRTYEEVRPLAEQIGRTEEIDKRLSQAREKRFEQALEVGDRYERQSDWSRALQEYRSVENLAKLLGRTHELESKIANARVREALASGESLENQGRWTDAIRTYQDVETQAGALGLGEEVTQRLLRARRGLVRAFYSQAQEFERQGDYRRAIAVLQSALETARITGETEKLDQEIARLKGRVFDQSLEEARGMRNRGDFDGALRHYESIRPFARELGREDELERHVKLCTGELFDQSTATGRRMEQEGRWDEAIAYYLGLADLARRAGQEESLGQHLHRVRNGRLEATLAAARECERQDDWSGALALYDRALGWSDEVGRREEVQGYRRAAQEELALLQYPHNAVTEHSFAMPGDVVAMDFDAEGAHFVVGDSTGQVWIFDLHNQCSCSFKLDAQNKVNDVAISPDGKFVAATAIRTVTVWDTHRGRRLVDFDVDDQAHAVSFSPDGTEVLVARENGAVEAWTWRTSRRRMSFRGHRSCVNWIGWLPGNNHFVTVCGSGEARRWDWNEGECRATMTLSDQGLRHAAFGGRTMATVGADDAVSVWDPMSFQSSVRFQTTGPTVCALVGRGRYLMVADAAGGLRTIDVRRNQTAHSQAACEDGVVGILVHPDGLRFATAGKDRTVKIWRRQ